MFKRITAFCFTALLSVSFLYAEPFRIVGSRAMGMGGAFVAVTGDNPQTAEAVIQYWNPAALALHEGFDIKFPISAEIEATGGILNSAKNISDSAARFSEINAAQASGSYITLQQLREFSKAVKNLNDLNKPGLGLLAGVKSGLNSAYRNWAVSVNVFTSIGVDPNIDLSSLFLGSGTVSSPSIRKSVSYAPGDTGVDLSTIPGMNTADPSDPDLDAASSGLASTLTTLVTEAGVDLGGNTPEQVANALINYAVSQGMSESEILESIATINELQPLLQQILAGGDPSKIFSGNKSNITITGLSLVELCFGYGRNAEFIKPYLKDLYLGANLKYLKGTVGYFRQNLWQEDGATSDSLLTDYKKNYATSSNIGLDLGFLYDRKTDYKTRAGILIRNLNKPSFKRPQAAVDNGYSSKYSVDPQVRLGLASWPMNWWIIALDFDVTRNKTQVEGYESRLLSLGTEFNLINKPFLNFGLRTGLYKNTANKDAATAYTFGLGLNLYHFIFDLSGAVSSDKVKIEDDTEIPSSLQVALSLGFNF